MKIGSVYMEITNRCNLNCTTCYNRSGKNRQTCELTVDKVGKVVERFRQYGCDSFTFSGGEPFLHSEIDELLSYISRREDCRFSIVTNGTLIKQNHINRISSLRNVWVQISLDGANEESNARIRGKGNFDKPLSSIRNLSRSGVPCIAKMVITKSNFREIEPFYRLMANIRVPPAFDFVICRGNGSEDWEEKGLTAEEKLIAMGIIRRLNSETGMEAEIPRCSYSCPLKDADGIMHVLVKADGKIQPCQSMYDDDCSIGDALKSSEREIEQKLRYFSEVIISRKERDYGCERCILQDRCDHGCPAIAKQKCGSLWGDDGECLIRKKAFLKGIVDYNTGNGK